MKNKMKDLLINLLLEKTAGGGFNKSIDLAVSIYAEINDKEPNEVKELLNETYDFIWTPFIEDYNCNTKYWKKFQERYEKELITIL